MPDSPARPLPARDRSLDLLRVVAIVGVVSIHTFGALMVNPAAGTTDRWVAVSMNSSFIWAVPVFVMISGALLLDPRMHSGGVGRFYARRLTRLLPAFVFWQGLYLIVVRQWLSGLHESPGDILQLILAGAPYTHLYFLWLIVGLYAVAPVLYAFLTQGGQPRALWFAGITLGVTVLTYWSSAALGFAGTARPLYLLAFTQWIPYVGYFLAGWALREVRLSAAWRWAVTVVAVLSVAEIVLQSGFRVGGVGAVLSPLSYLGPVPAVAALAIFLAFRAWTTARSSSGRVLAAASDAAFGVFLIHFVVLILLRGLPAFAGADTSAGVSIALWIATTVTSFAVVLVVRRVPYLRRLV